MRSDDSHQASNAPWRGEGRHSRTFSAHGSSLGGEEVRVSPSRLRRGEPSVAEVREQVELVAGPLHDEGVRALAGPHFTGFRRSVEEQAEHKNLGRSQMIGAK